MPALTKKPQSRREFFAALRNWGLIAGVVGIGGWYAVSEVSANIREQDLSRLGNGIPTIVQIHDPQCPRCRALQKETRAALEAFGDGEFQYVVANIRGAEGRSFAERHGVGHVTLLLFDGQGRRQGVLQGNLSRSALIDAFQQHLGLAPLG